MKKKLGAILLVVALAVSLGLVPATPALASPGLAAQWHFDEGSGTTTSDSSVNSNTGTISGASWTSGKYGQALSFDGSGDSVDCGNDASLQVTDAFTVEAWVYWTGETGGYDTILARGAHMVAGGFSATIRNSTDELWIFRNGGSVYFDTNLSLTKNQWNHVAVVKYANDDLKVYLNVGTPATTTGFDIGTPVTNLPVHIGFWTDYWTGGHRFNGTIDEVRIWDEARTASQIQQSYEALHVDDDGAQWPGGYTTIQAAIDVANPGDFIMVHDGTYAEDLTITLDDLLLKPAPGEDVTIQGVTTLTWGNWPLAAPNIEILADGVRIGGFTIESPNVAADSYSSGIVLDGEDIEIYDNSFVSQGAAAGGSVVIQTYRDNVLGYASDISGLNIHDNDFTETSGGQYVGVFINHTLTGSGTVYVEDNTFSGGMWQGIVTERSNTVIKGNTIEGSSVYGITVMDWDGRDQDNVQIECNVVSGFDYGILIGHSSGTQVLTNISVTCNRVQENDVGIKVRSSADGVVVNCNNISGNITYGVENTTTTTLDATNNWWGHASGPNGFGPGSGDAVSDYVDYSQWAYIPDFCEAKSMGYWKTHPELVDGILGVEGVATVELGGEEVTLTWAQEIFASAKSKNYYMLAAQLLAAKLNVLQLEHFNPGYDFSCVVDVDTVYFGDNADAIAEADALLTGVTDFSSRLPKSDRAQVNELKDILDAFNNDGCAGNVCPCDCD